MELDDFFGNKHQDQTGNRNYRYQDRSGYSQNLRHSFQRHDSSYKMAYFLENLKTNRKLKQLVIFTIILILAIIIALIAIFLPLILKLLNYISQNGVQGILENVTGFLDKLWKGSGK